MYLAYIAPHFPLQARPEVIEKYWGKYSEGYEYYPDERFQKQKELGVVHKNTILFPAEFKTWEKVDNKQEEDLKMAVYAAQVDRMDQNIGRLVKELKDMEILDNTFILFLSDNGAGYVDINDTPYAEIGTRNSWVSYGWNWGNVSITPYRYYKAFAHDGGIIIPLIIHWSNGIKNKGLISLQPVHIIDIMSILLSLVKTTYPQTFDNEKLVPITGKSILPLINGGKQDPEKVMFWEHEGNKAVRIGE